MPERVAFDAIVWLIHASRDARQLNVAFMGGEPLIRFALMRKLVPFAKRRAWQHGKQIHFGMTTNCTLVTAEVVAFFREWGMGFHTSIDGIPPIQDKNRPLASGRGSSRMVECAVPMILAYRPGVTARCTVVPENAPNVWRNYKYFRSLGYTDVAIVPGNAPDWNDVSLKEFEKQFTCVGETLIEEMRAGTFVRIKGINESIQAIVSKQRGQFMCGAGRGMVLIDVYGDIWPCHRWNKERNRSWRIGSIYSGFNEDARAELDVGNQVESLEADCCTCGAQTMCQGGCPAESLEATGSAYRPHPNSCELTRICAAVGQHVHDTLVGEGNATFLDHYYRPPEPKDGTDAG